PPRSPLFPYTTLFRSVVTKQKRSVDEILSSLDEDEKDEAAIAAVEKMSDDEVSRDVRAAGIDVEKMKARILAARPPSFAWKAARSEEHTSELQSPCNL